MHPYITAYLSVAKAQTEYQSGYGDIYTIVKAQEWMFEVFKNIR